MVVQLSNLDNYNKMVNLNNLSENKTTYKEIIEKQGFYIATPVGFFLSAHLLRGFQKIRQQEL